MARLNNPPLSAYRFMWLMVMFDLPVLTKLERRAATKFRQFLLDEGYEMSQFSIYMRFCVGKEQVDRRVRDIAKESDGTIGAYPFVGWRPDGGVFYAAGLMSPDYSSGDSARLVANISNFGMAPIPEPSSLLLLAGGLASLALARRRLKTR